MKFLLDTNSLNKGTAASAKKLGDVCVLQEVTDESAAYNESTNWVQSAGIEILYIESKHLLSLQELMLVEGSDLSVIRLYTGEGTADVLMIAFIIAERDFPETLFPEEYTIVTKDKGLSAMAQRHRILCIDSI